MCSFHFLFMPCVLAEYNYDVMCTCKVKRNESWLNGIIGGLKGEVVVGVTISLQPPKPGWKNLPQNGHFVILGLLPPFRCYIADRPPLQTFPRTFCNGTEKPLQIFPHCRSSPISFKSLQVLTLHIHINCRNWKEKFNT